MEKKSEDILDHTVKFLQKRDGIDKVLKICRYSAKLVLAADLGTLNKDASRKLKDFESSLGVSRKAYRLGKFLQDVNALRRTSIASKEGFLEFIASGGEGVYYFVEQFVWLVKAGVIDKRHARRLAKISAWAEFIGYFGSVAVKSLQISAILHKERRISQILVGQKSPSAPEEEEDHACGPNSALAGEGKPAQQLTSPRKYPDIVANLRRDLNILKMKRVMKTLSLVQDLADALMALDDIRESKDTLSNPMLLSAAGLLSAIISAHKNWVTV